MCDEGEALVLASVSLQAEIVLKNNHITFPYFTLYLSRCLARIGRLFAGMGQEQLDYS